MVKDEFWNDEALAQKSRDARLIFIGIWNFSDDYGVVNGNAVWLKNHILPYDDSLNVKEFSKWIIIANIIGWPIAYYLMNQWLDNFAYQTNLSWYIFFIAGVVAFILAFITISYQSIKAASANPIDSIKYE